MEESASHHETIICFAQLRAAMTENCAREARISLEIMKILNFITFGNQHFWISTPDYLIICNLCHYRFRHRNLTKMNENLTEMLSSKALKISDLKLKYHTKCWNLGFCPSGPPDRRNGGECFAPWNNHLLCAAARRNGWKLCSGSPEITRNHENSEFGYLWKSTFSN